MHPRRRFVLSWLAIETGRMTHSQYQIGGSGLSNGKDAPMTGSSSHRDESDLSLLAADQYFRQMRRIVRLSLEEEQRYLARLARGQWEQRQAQPNQWRLMLAREARNRLLESYQPLIVHYAHVYHRYCWRLELLDLIQEGNLALLAALEQRDHRDPRPFQQFAGLCIRHRLVGALLRQDCLIRVTAQCRRLAAIAGRVQERLQQEYGFDPSLAQVAQAMQCDEASLAEKLALARRQEVESLQAILERCEDEADDGVLQMLGLYEPVPGIAPERLAELREQLQRAVRCLSERQRLVLTWRYGLDEERAEECSLEEIAQRLGCTYNTARCAEVEARKHLAHWLRLEVEADGVRCVVREEVTGFLEDAWYTWEEASAKLGCSRVTLRKKVHEGQLVEYKVSRQLGAVYPRAMVDRLVAQRPEQVA